MFKYVNKFINFQKMISKVPNVFEKYIFLDKIVIPFLPSVFDTYILGLQSPKASIYMRSFVGNVIWSIMYFSSLLFSLYNSIVSMKFLYVYCRKKFFFWKKLSVNENRRRSQKSKHSTQIVVSSKQQLVSKYIRKNSQEEVCSLALCSKSRNTTYYNYQHVNVLPNVPFRQTCIAFDLLLFIRNKHSPFFLRKKAIFQFQSQCNYQNE